jgi:hypothetical protein
MDIIERVAARFVELAKDKLMPHELDEVIELNFWEEDPNICHTHDFMDANEAMCNAFEDATGCEFLQNSEEHVRLWGLAWQAAKRKLPHL